ncbi:MAG TPA: MerR family transcriptional regulator [Thermoanaerobaculia bacterium]|nr:MerR family transcriptional regulator [Thermoanaerobaculia bacterium]
MGKKLFYRIGEACKQLDIQPYVLRYWETEFPVLSPRKSKAGQRVYSEEELQLIQRIKQLLYEEGYTIAGAKKKLEAELANGRLPAIELDGDEEPGDSDDVEEREAAPAPRVAPEAAAAPAHRLDTEAAQQVEKFRTGVREALAQAREILQLLP